MATSVSCAFGVWTWRFGKAVSQNWTVWNSKSIICASHVIPNCARGHQWWGPYPPAIKSLVYILFGLSRSVSVKKNALLWHTRTSVLYIPVFWARLPPPFFWQTWGWLYHAPMIPYHHYTPIFCTSNLYVRSFSQPETNVSCSNTICLLKLNPLVG